MNVGETKGKEVEEIVKSRKPKVSERASGEDEEAAKERVRAD